jgi:xanthine/CO dehydrogenase XdhC/CoxF family maturation factor
MGETADVLAAISSYRANGAKIALATIVGVRGSTYRRAGARLVVAEDGTMVGNLSGGCLEGEVHDLAHFVMESGTPRLESYDLTADDEVVWGWGLGCNGAIDVFIEPGDKAAEVADAIRLAVDAERPVVVATVITSSLDEVEPGARVVFAEGSPPLGKVGLAALDRAVADEAERARTGGVSEVRPVPAEGGQVDVFFEVIDPPPRLVICGAGHDAIPLAAAAAGLGWRVVVADDREGMLTARRFPAAGDLVLTEPGEVTEKARIDDRSFVVVMSHNYLRDRDYLRSLLGSDAAYVGMLGPKARLERLLGDLSSDGVELPAASLERVYGPAGLDLGAEGPEEIAAAIVAEILALVRNRNAGFLKDRDAPIHPRLEPAI